MYSIKEKKMYNQVDVFTPHKDEDFVETPYIKELTERAVSYIIAGFPVNLSGPVGVGKTTLALHIAAQLAQPSVLISGEYEFTTSDLVGRYYGYHRNYLRDNYISSVLKIEEKISPEWIDNSLTTACKYGFTLIYDEFTRSRPETNNVLLSVLEERILPLSASNGEVNYIKVHPNFAAIFTSNYEEYAGVQPSQDALRDRMITMELSNFDEETEIAITQAKSNLPFEDAQRIVNLVRKVREAKSNKFTPTVRACVMMGKVLKLKDESTFSYDRASKQIFLDILMPGVPKEEKEKVREVIEEALTAERQ